MRSSKRILSGRFRSNTPCIWLVRQRYVEDVPAQVASRQYRLGAIGQRGTDQVRIAA